MCSHICAISGLAWIFDCILPCRDKSVRAVISWGLVHDVVTETARHRLLGLTQIANNHARSVDHIFSAGSFITGDSHFCQLCIVLRSRLEYVRYIDHTHTSYVDWKPTTTTRAKKCARPLNPSCLLTSTFCSFDTVWRMELCFRHGDVSNRL